MFTVIIAVIAGCGIMLVTSRDLGPVWGVVCGIATVMVVQLLIGLLVRGKVNAVNRKMQQVMAEAQAKLNRKVQMFQNAIGIHFEKIGIGFCGDMENTSVFCNHNATALFFLSL